MDLLITVSSAASGDILAPLLQACKRRGCDWQVFLNFEGVAVLERNDIAQLLSADPTRAIVCHDSWNRFGGENDCPVTLGSQTNHAAMVGEAARVVSL